MIFSAANSPIDELDRLADSLGDPTRRAIFLLVRESPHSLTASDVAETIGIHRTVARGHLERLVEAGLLSSSHVHRPEGGRPPKVYTRSERRLNVQLPARQYELLADLLLETLEKFGDAAELMARDVGYAFGEQLAATTAGDSLEERLQPLYRAGAALEATKDGEKVHMRLSDCLFREISGRRPRLVCALDRALMEGLLSTADTRYVLGDVERRCAAHDVCHLTYVSQAPPERYAAPRQEAVRSALEEGEQ